MPVLRESLVLQYPNKWLCSKVCFGRDRYRAPAGKPEPQSVDPSPIYSNHCLHGTGKGDGLAKPIFV
jgi:hypothetical protein